MDIRDYSSESTYKNIPGLSECDTSKCAGKEAAIRTTLGGCLFFLLHSIAIIGVQATDDPRLKCHTHCWPVQVLAWVVLEVASFLLPSEAVQVYFQLARIAAGAFLVLQIVCLLDVVYKWNEAWLGHETLFFKLALITVSFLAYGASFVGVGVLFYVFAPAADCSLNIFFVVFTLMCMLGYSAISLHPKVNAGLLTSGLIFGYSVFLCWSALLSLPPKAHCAFSNEGGGEGGDENNVQAIKVVGFMLALGAALVATVRTAEDGAEGVYSVESSTTAYRADLLHLTFALGCTYIAMLLSAWSLNGTSEEWELDRGWISVWVKIVAQWITGFIYTW
eukprot:CAMPEP_0196576496 /NCGR_PEP_ID=MMETSP1081-20130531/5732_1 /TAXON_ID=36882 /ORGANISM="Pyramimonas amylifera, Strain CCMP720" /LENGTH=333 /DNA_ID=CAMNT_0041895111 /DNA_START=241 /DNA_END=1240 /DNA_ORIENTATION=+